MRIDISKIRKTLVKIKRNDPVLFRKVRKKIMQVASYDKSTLQHLKNLRYDLKEFKRVQIGAFILIFRVEGDTVYFEYFCHHDEAYRR